MDQIILKRTVAGEFAPQYWTLTGGEFGDMLSKVKALEFRQWNDRERVWHVKLNGLQALLDSGLTVTRNPDVRVELHNGQSSIEKLDNGANVEIVLNYRNASNDRERWAVIPEAVPHFITTLHFDFAPEQISEIAAQVRTDETVLKHISEKNLESYCHDSAILTLAMRAIAELSEQAQACYKEYRGKRSLEEHHAAVEAVWQFIESRK